MKRILRCDWLPERQDGPILPARDSLLWSREKKYLLEARLHSFLTLHNEAIYKTLIITSV